jgi:CelD/BcsL family acetyltransferase involved in cellulose biosynthesis
VVSVPQTARVIADLGSLVPEWEQLAERVDGSPFLRPGWILPWLEAFGTGAPEAITVRREGELVGLLPMQRRGGRLRSVANWHSPVFGPLVLDDAARDAVLDQLFGAGRSSVELSLLDDELLASIGDSARGAGRRVVKRTIASCPVVEMGDCFEEYERGLSRNRRRSLRRGRRCLEAEGDLTFDIHTGLDGLDGALEELFAVELSGWKGRRGTAIASNGNTRGFYSDVAHWAAARGWLRLAALRVDGRAIACDYSIAFDGTWFSLKSGYDEDYRRFGPGALLLREELRHCFEQGVTSLELLGTEDAFKLSWTERSSERARLHAFDRSVAGLAHWSLVTGRDGLRPALHWLRSRVRDGAVRAHHAFASALASWDSLGLEALPAVA